MNLIDVYQWKTFTILYQDNQGLVRMHELLKAPTDSDIKIIVKQLDFTEEDANM